MRAESIGAQLQRRIRWPICLYAERTRVIELARAAGIATPTVGRLKVGGTFSISPERRHDHVSRI
jgi:hypothetical protein